MSEKMSSLITVAVCAVSAAFFLLAVTVSAPCVSEDGTWCTWYATSQGNGQGKSFIAFTDEIVWYM